MSTCPRCGAPMVQMIMSAVCKAECDLRPKVVTTSGVTLRDGLSIDEAWISLLSGWDIWPAHSRPTVNFLRRVGDHIELRRDSDDVSHHYGRFDDHEGFVRRFQAYRSSWCARKKEIR